MTGLTGALGKLPVLSLLVPIGAAGAFFMAWLTPFGVGIYVDSLYYVSSARNLVAGMGLGRVTGLGDFKPMTHYPPFYSIILALFDLIGIRELTTARWISILAFGLAIVLVGLIVYQRSGSRIFSVFSSILILASNPILRNFSWAMTEPLYIALMLSSLLSFGTFLRNEHRRWLVLSAIFTSLALLTRYVGFSLVAAFCLVILFNRRSLWRTRFQDLTIFLSITLLPILAWLVRNWIVAGSLTNRLLDWHPVSKENVSYLIKSLSSWGFIPQRLAAGRELLVYGGFLVCLALLSVFWLVKVFPKSGQAPEQEYVVIFACWLYLGLLITSLFFLDATTRLENRILLPLYTGTVLLIMIGLALSWQRKNLWSRVLITLICAWLAYFSLTRVDGAIADLRSNGQGYASLRWQNSPTATYIRQQNPALIYTNDITAIYFLAEKNSIGIPNASATEADFTQMRDHLSKPNSYLVIFGTLTGEFAPLNLLTNGLSMAGSFADGTIYHLDKGSNP